MAPFFLLNFSDGTAPASALVSRPAGSPGGSEERYFSHLASQPSTSPYQCFAFVPLRTQWFSSG